MDIKNRIVEIRKIRLGDVQPNERNPRTHPEDQKIAYRSALNVVGWAGVPLAYNSKRQGGLTFLDGHMRQIETPDLEAEIAITDLTDREADLLMLTYDPIGSMAEQDASQIDDIIQDASKAMLAGLSQQMVDDIVAGSMAEQISALDASDEKDTRSRQKEILISNLVPNTYASYAMTKKEFSLLKRSMDTVGLLSSILVRPVEGDKYEVVHGMQRYRAAIELGWKSMPAFIRDLTDSEAKILAFSANKLQGKVVGARAREAFDSAGQDIDDESVQAKMSASSGVTQQNMRTYSKDAGYGHSVDEDTGVMQREFAEYTGERLQPLNAENITLMIPLSADNFDLVDEVLTSISHDWGAAIMTLIKDYKQ